MAYNCGACASLTGRALIARNAILSDQKYDTAFMPSATSTAITRPVLPPNQ